MSTFHSFLSTISTLTITYPAFNYNDDYDLYIPEFRLEFVDTAAKSFAIVNADTVPAPHITVSRVTGTWRYGNEVEMSQVTKGRR